MVKILNFSCARKLLTKSYVYMFSLIYICLDFH